VTIIRRGNAWLSGEDGLLWVEGVCGRLHIIASFGENWLVRAKIHSTQTHPL
jgi:hypothetical protein